MHDRERQLQANVGCPVALFSTAALIEADNVTLETDT
jgi:hypothetical protein